MKKRITIILIAAMALTALALTLTAGDKEDKAHMTAAVGKQAPDFTLTAADGETHSLSDFAGKYVVLEWINFGCPFVRKFYDAGVMQKMQADYREKDVVWLAVCSSAPGKQGYMQGEALTEHLKQEEIKANAYLLDTDGTVGKMYGAKTTPNMYVINPEGVLIYAGAIDDKPSPKKETLEDANNYVVNALNAAMAGKEVPTKATQPYGCSVKYK